jgi:two-component system OmpR family sensor kinase
VVDAVVVGITGTEDGTAEHPDLGDLPNKATVISRAGYRVQIEPLPNGGSVVVAAPLDETERTVSRLVRIELFVLGAVLAALAALAWWVVKVGLRPLERMGETAHAIAEGDLARRVEPDDDRTEVGRLGHSLNAMLHQIEVAFDERTQSEDRLRRFVADVSHELRTPLTSIRGYAELFRRGAADRPEDLATSMRRIEEEAARLGVLVDDLLLLARLDQGRPLEHQPVDLARIARDAAADARAAQPDREVTVVGDGDGGALVITGDDGRLRQAVQNLVGNALAHTPAGSPVEIRLAQQNGHALLEVADHGPGLDPGHAAHVFERFYRVDESRSRSAGGGTGLGLSIVAAVAEAHGGRAEVDPRPGQGAVFRLVLPAFATSEENRSSFRLNGPRT